MATVAPTPVESTAQAATNPAIQAAQIQAGTKKPKEKKNVGASDVPLEVSQLRPGGAHEH